MEWFKVYADLKGHPKRYRFEALAGTKHGLHYIVAFWSYVCKYATDGDVTSMTPQEIASASEWHGDAQVFFAALVESGFIDATESGFIVHDWADEHKRFITENLKPRGNAYVPRASQGTNAIVPRASLGRREEKRIEEKEEKRVKPKPIAAHAAEFEAFWQSYPRKVGKGAAMKAWFKNKPPLQECLDTLGWQCKDVAWTKDGGQFIPHASTWLNGQRWLDQKESGRGTGRGEGWTAPSGGDDF